MSISILERRATQKRAPAKTINTIAARSLQVLLTTGLVIAGLELIFAAAGVGEQEYLKPDALLGFAGMPHKQVTWRSEGFSRTTFNELGMNDADGKLWSGMGSLANESPRMRIAVCGDSFVEALQVPREANFCTLIEKRLPDCSVINLGTSAYNLGQMYLLLKERVLPTHPHFVLLALRHDSVFNLVPNTTGGFMAARPVFYLDGEEKLQMSSALQEQWQSSADGKRMRTVAWLREHSRIWGVLSLVMQDISTFKLPVLLPAAQAAGSNTDTPLSGFHDVPPQTATATENKTGAKQDNQLVATSYYWPLAEALIERIKYECDRNGTRLVILRLPPSGTVNNPVETLMLEETAERLSIDLVSSESDFAQAAKRGQRTFYDVHLSSTGHKLLANLLVPKLQQLLQPTDNMTMPPAKVR